MLDIPVFHDDQHGTAIIATAALINALEIVGKPIAEAKIVVNGAGASAISCAKMFLMAGATLTNITMVDSKGVIYAGRQAGMNDYKAQFAKETEARTLLEAMQGADVMVGLSVADSVSVEMVKAMAPRPIIFAMANRTRKLNTSWPAKPGPMPSSPPAAAIIPTRSTTSWGSPLFSGGRWMCRPARLMTR
jgi:malate dehydrogenase (oxaloacetate-decarboxylating)(NADP+)